MSKDLYQQHQDYFSYDSVSDPQADLWAEFFESEPEYDVTNAWNDPSSAADETYYDPGENASFMMAADPYLDIVKPATDAGMDLGFTPEAIRRANLEYEEYADFVDASRLERSIAGTAKSILGALKAGSKLRQANRRKPGARRPTTREKTRPPTNQPLSQERASPTRPPRTQATKNALRAYVDAAYDTNTVRAKASEDVERRFEVTQNIASRAKRLTI